MSETLIKQIEEAYEHDQATNAKPVVSREHLPISYDYITPEWLTDVLCRDVPGSRVISFELGEVDSGTSNRRKITVNYNSVGEQTEELPRKLFCKAAHDLANRVTVVGIGSAQSETSYYRYIRPHLEIESPICYFGAIDHDTFNAMLILGDISESVTEFCDHRTEMTKERVLSQLRLLATVHGRCYSDSRLNEATRSQFLSWREFFDVTCKFGMQNASEEGFRMSGEIGLIPPSLYSRAGEIWPATRKSFDLHDQGPQTLGHNDVHLKNWYVAGDGNMGLGDWQCAAHGHWARDVAYALSCGLTIENRRAWENDLLRFYGEELARQGGPVLGNDEIWLRYRQQMITALTWWTITINPAPDMPDMQPRDVTEAFIRRIGTALDDLGTLDALKN